LRASAAAPGSAPGIRRPSVGEPTPAFASRAPAPGSVFGGVARPPAGAGAARSPVPPQVAASKTNVETAGPAEDAPDALAAKVAEIRELARSAGDLAELARRVAGCTACGLCATRKQTVFADGRARIPVMFVGEAPGEQEDLQGLPFVGRAGQLLTDIITKGMRLTREDVYIANVLKCRPPENRDPTELEKRLCTPWLDRQIELVDPKVIIPLGRHAAMHVLKVEASMGSLRGRVHVLGSRKVVPTYHPAYLLRDPSKKTECWKDIQLAMAELGLAPPAKPGAS
ncbi:MAG: uracil-DNA glycosylase, partial [Planctomycetes bacterium]|nr:uracil-DNA glycosylase [Planctomycetota bacterium]